MAKKKKGFIFPSAYTVLIIVTLLAAILTWIIPAGAFSTISYDEGANNFVITAPSGTTQKLPAVQGTLDKYGIKAKVADFSAASHGRLVGRTVSVPGSYAKTARKGQGLVALIEAPVKGITQVIDIMLFVLILGGMIGIIESVGVFNSGIKSLARAMKGKEMILIIVVCTLIGIGGTTFGLAEETMAFYPILIPIFLVSGYDAIVVIASIYLGSSVGTMISTVNPFSVIIASTTAGVNWTHGIVTRLIFLVVGITVAICFIIWYARRVKKDPSKSLVYKYKDEIEKRFLSEEQGEERAFDWRAKLSLTVFGLTFVVMVIGVAFLNWWFLEMTTLFLVSALIIGIIEGIPENKFVSEFVQGSRALLGVGFIIGIARGINVIMDDGNITATIVHTASTWVNGLGPYGFIAIMLIVFCILGFFIPSSSGLAVLSMPIMAPLADVVGLPRNIVVNAYMYGMGILAIITPTGLILPSLSMLGDDVSYDKWMRFIWPFLIIMFVLALIVLFINVATA